MLLEEIINPDAVLCNAHARSKKHCLEILSELLVRSIPDISADDIFENLNERERLGCTSLNQGVAFPHCRVEGLNESVAALIKLSEPVDFDAGDDYAVFNVASCLVTTGNLVAINSFSNNPIFPTFATQVQIRQSAAPVQIVQSSTKGAAFVY